MSIDWEELSDRISPCPTCGHEEIMMKIEEGPKCCECLRCGEKSVEVDVTPDQMVEIWNYHCETVKRVLERARLGKVILRDGDDVTIDMDEARKLADSLSTVNMFDVEEVSFMEDGKVLDISPHKLEEFRFTGLCLIDFIRSRFWETENI